jgi:hypothetical protein
MFRATFYIGRPRAARGSPAATPRTCGPGTAGYSMGVISMSNKSPGPHCSAVHSAASVVSLIATVAERIRQRG